MSRSPIGACAAVAFRPGAEPSAASAALAALLPNLSRLAARFAGRDHTLADDLVGHLLLQCARGRYDPARDSFPTWASRVLGNARIDHARAARHRPPPTREPTPDAAAAVDAHDLLTALFGRSDLVAILSWPAKVRVVLLVRGLMWEKLPAADRAATREAVGLSSGFPGVGYAELPEGERHAALAAALGLTVNGLHQRWRRWRPRLMALRFVREVGEGQRG